MKPQPIEFNEVVSGISDMPPRIPTLLSFTTPLILFSAQFELDVIVAVCALCSLVIVSKSVDEIFLFVCWCSCEFGSVPFCFLGPMFMVLRRQGVCMLTKLFKTLKATSNSITFSFARTQCFCCERTFSSLCCLIGEFHMLVSSAITDGTTWRKEC